MKTVFVAALAFAVACVVAGVIILSRPAKPDTVLPAATDTSRFAAPPPALPPAVAEVAAPSLPSVTPQEAPPPKAAAPARRGAIAKEPLHDPLSRVALAFVGADSTADEYWFAAINDPNLPAHERQDLIEDLNEEGLSDPKHPSPEDLPLILTRLQLIEMVEPDAMDQVNADAFLEAYKDLVNLASLALGGGEPVR